MSACDVVLRDVCVCARCVCCSTRDLSLAVWLAHPYVPVLMVSGDLPLGDADAPHVNTRPTEERGWCEAERRLAEMQNFIKKSRAQLQKVKSGMDDANDPKAQRVQELFARDKEMSELIDTFDEKKAEEVAKAAAAQTKIVLLLQF